MRNFKEGKSSFWITLDPGMEQEYLKDNVAGIQYLQFPGHWFPFPTGHTAGQDSNHSPFWINSETEIPLQEIHPESIYTNGSAWIFRVKDTYATANSMNNYHGWVCSVPHHWFKRTLMHPHNAHGIFVSSPKNAAPMRTQPKNSLDFLQNLLAREYFFQFTTESREDLRTERDRLKNSLDFKEETIAKLELRLSTAVDKKKHETQVWTLKEQVAKGVENNNSLQEVVDTMKFQTSTLRSELSETQSDNIENILLIENAQAELESLTKSLDETEVKLAAALSDDLEDEEEIKELLHAKRTLSSELEVAKSTIESAAKDKTEYTARETSLVDRLDESQDKLENKIEELNSVQSENHDLNTRLAEKTEKLDKMNNWDFANKLAWLFGI